MKRRWSVLASKSRAALHTKSVVFDRQSVFIGSFNLDPRSAALNTEVGVMIESAAIARQVGELMENLRLTSPCLLRLEKRCQRSSFGFRGSGRRCRDHCVVCGAQALVSHREGS